VAAVVVVLILGLVERAERAAAVMVQVPELEQQAPLILAAAAVVAMRTVRVPQAALAL
jgi:hypothetical protein